MLESVKEESSFLASAVAAEVSSFVVAFPAAGLASFAFSAVVVAVVALSLVDVVAFELEWLVVVVAQAFY